MTAMGMTFTHDQAESSGFSLSLCPGIIVENFPYHGLFTHTRMAHSGSLINMKQMSDTERPAFCVILSDSWVITVLKTLG